MPPHVNIPPGDLTASPRCRDILAAKLAEIDAALIALEGGSPRYDTVIDFTWSGALGLQSDVDFGVLGQNTLIRLLDGNRDFDGMVGGVDGITVTFQFIDPPSTAPIIVDALNSVSATANLIYLANDEQLQLYSAVTLRYSADGFGAGKTLPGWSWISSTVGLVP